MEENRSSTASGFGQPHFCSQCGAKLGAGDNFCPYCGTKVSQSQDEGTRAAQTPDAQEERPAQPLETTGEKSLPKGFAAFAEMWGFIALLVKTTSKEGKRECRREAKLRMYRAPLLTLACPVTVLALLALFIVLDIKTKVPVFGLGVVAFAVISLFLIPLLLVIFFTKFTDEDKAKLSAAEVWTGDATSQKPTKNIGCFVRTLLFLFVVGLIAYAVFSFKDDFATISRSIASSTKGSLSHVSSFGFKTKHETPVADISNAKDINYESHSSLSPGTICKISNYRVFTTGSDRVIARFDYAEDFKVKSAARAFLGDGLVTLAEMGENSSKPNIVIITERKLCDDDAIPTLYARYEGAVDTAFGRLRCFQEVRPLQK